MKPTYPVLGSTRQFSRYAKTNRQDQQMHKKYADLAEGAVPIIREHVVQQVAWKAEYDGFDIYDPVYDRMDGVEESHENRAYRVGLGAFPEIKAQALHLLGKACQVVGVPDGDEIVRGRARDWELRRESASEAERYAPELENEPDTVRRIAAEQGPQAVAYEAYGRNPELFLDDVLAGRFDPDTVNAALRYNPPNSSEGFVEPALPADLASKMPVEDLRTQIANEALDRLGRGPAGPYDALTNDEIKSLIDGPAPKAD